jgi:hypothetical protein
MLPAKIQPSKLTDADLDALVAVAFNVWDHATDLSLFVSDVCTDEIVRRLERKPVPSPVKFPEHLSRAALAESLMAIQAFSLAATSRAAREFVSSVSSAVSAAAAAQLV